MPTKQHDLLADLFRKEPLLAGELLIEMGVDIPPPKAATEISESCTDLKTTEYAADSAVLLELTEGGSSHAVIVEVQRAIDEDKHFTWPLYLAVIRARKRCPTTLLVIAPDPKVADWCALPIEDGHPGHVLKLLVVKAEHVPVMTDPQEIAANHAMGVLSAMFHGAGDCGTQVQDASHEAFRILRDTDKAVANRYYDTVLAAVPDAVRGALEHKMRETTEYYSDFFRDIMAEGLAKGQVEGRVEGRVEGEAVMLLTMIEARGFELTVEQRERISGCQDDEQLREWGRRAATATTPAEIFA